MPLSPNKRGQREQEAEPGSHGLVTLQDPTGGSSEDYRTLRTSLLYSLVDSPPKAIVVTSPGPGEGKSTLQSIRAKMLGTVMNSVKTDKNYYSY